ncbi:hypothetical protein HU200_065397 [Digitaria exilis]|uniref:Uncharacterized protein n=1 Tax=Digitaria exilis TaxID=1010633 RepID=A0A835A874_9POAL|nr:hypothetical protein HU200_065397 [Digitaria exilis]
MDEIPGWLACCCNPTQSASRPEWSSPGPHRHFPPSFLTALHYANPSCRQHHTLSSRMTASMRRSTSHRFHYEPPVICPCGKKAARWISWSDQNPGHRYFKCYRVFEWQEDGFNPPLPQTARQVVTARYVQAIASASGLARGSEEDESRSSSRSRPATAAAAMNPLGRPHPILNADLLDLGSGEERDLQKELVVKLNTLAQAVNVY